MSKKKWKAGRLTSLTRAITADRIKESSLQRERDLSTIQNRKLKVIPLLQRERDEATKGMID